MGQIQILLILQKSKGAIIYIWAILHDWRQIQILTIVHNGPNFKYEPFANPDEPKGTPHVARLVVHGIR